MKQRDSYRAAIEAIQDAGITVNGCFVLGLDGQDRTSFDAVFDFVRASGLYEVQVTVMTAFPNAPLYDRSPARTPADPTAWETCTLFDVNYVPERMSVPELEGGFRDLVKRIYDTGFVEERRRRFFERQSALRQARPPGRHRAAGGRSDFIEHRAIKAAVLDRLEQVRRRLDALRAGEVGDRARDEDWS